MIIQAYIQGLLLFSPGRYRLEHPCHIDNQHLVSSYVAACTTLLFDRKLRPQGSSKYTNLWPDGTGIYEKRPQPMKEFYCWRCEKKVPMLEEDEWTVIAPLITSQMENIKRYQEEQSVDLQTATLKAEKPATDKYLEFTGVTETSYAVIWHHRLSDYGPECKKCGHLFKTPTTTRCSNCGQKAILNNR